MSKFILQVLENHFTIYRFQPSDAVPASVLSSSFFWVGKTDEELSIVCDSSLELAGGKKSTGWACLKVPGPMNLSVIGVLAGISVALASARISIFAISTFDTDYILVKSTQLEEAKNALIKSGYGVEDSRPN
jgi:hypothetical protein